MASISGSASNSSYDPYARAIPNSRAAVSAFRASRDAIAAISHSSDCCIAGTTLVLAILAAPRTPHRILRMRLGYRNGGHDIGRPMLRLSAALLFLPMAWSGGRETVLFDPDSGLFGDDGAALVMLMRSPEQIFI